MKKTRIAALLLAALMIVSALPATALAAAHRHTWGEWKTTKEATCLKEGEEARTCSGCGKTETRKTKKLEHEFGEWTTTKVPTCTEPGEHERICKKCGHVRIREIEKLPHDWSAWKIKVAATEFSKGVKARHCAVCGLEETEEFYPDPTYKKNDRGEGVKKLQEKLNAAGYSCGSPSGKYGTSTEKAVKKLEKDHGFTEDGIAWPGVQAWLNGEYGWTPPADPEPEDEFEEPDDVEPNEAAQASKVSPASLQEEADDSGNFAFTVEALEPDTQPRYGGEFYVPFRITNTGKKAADIYYIFVLGLYGNPVAWTVPYETDEVGHWHYVHEPGQSSVLTVHMRVEDCDEERERVERDVWFQLRGQDSSGHNFTLDLDYELVLDFPDPAVELRDVSFGKGLSSPGDVVSIDGTIVNTGGKVLYKTSPSLYYWDKAAGDYVLDWTTVWKYGKIYPEEPPAYGFAYLSEKYEVTQRDLDNAEDGVARIALKALAETMDGTPVESELAVMEFNVAWVDLYLEAEDTSAEQEPVDGKVSLKLWLTNKGTESMSVDGSESFCCWPGFSPAESDHYKFGHGEGLFRLAPGATEEMDLELMVFPEDVEAGEVRRTVTLNMKRLVQKGGKRVLPDTPESDIVGMEGLYYTNELEIVIPLPPQLEEPVPEPGVTAAEPAPKAPERCSPRFVAAGDGSAERAISECSEHQEVAKAAAKLTDGAEGPEAAAAWEAAAKLWEDALKTEYDAAVKAAKGARRKALQAERAAFETLLAARKAAIRAEYPDDPVAAAKALAEVLEHKTCLVCYERHTTPDADRLLRGSADDTLSKSGAFGTCSVGTHRAGSKMYEAESLCAEHAAIDAMAAEAEDAEAWKQVKGLWIAELDRIADGRYLAADKAGRAAIAVERVAYGEWLKAREKMLNVLYPEQDAAVQELLAEAVRARVIGLCGFSHLPAER